MFLHCVRRAVVFSVMAVLNKRGHRERGLCAHGVWWSAQVFMASAPASLSLNQSLRIKSS
ncbi:MAG: hypothetical protein MI923_17375 [Phycisphaerales bacterium]|nr:hypothetical protein [Phycisphaerales bacterium]